MGVVTGERSEAWAHTGGPFCHPGSNNLSIALDGPRDAEKQAAGEATAALGLE